jgi:hypothetical protein
MCEVVLLEVVGSSESSPKSHTYEEMGAAVVPSPPPLTVAVKVQRWPPAVAVSPVAARATLSGVATARGVTVTVAVADETSPLISTAVTVAAYDLGVWLSPFGPA